MTKALTGEWTGPRLAGATGNLKLALRGPGPHLVGRGNADASLSLRNAANRVSRTHAEFAVDSTGWTVADLASTQGTEVNGTVLISGTKVQLFDNDIIVFGRGNDASTHDDKDKDSYEYKVLGLGKVRPALVAMAEPPPPLAPALNADDKNYLKRIRGAAQSLLESLDNVSTAGDMEAVWTAAGKTKNAIIGAGNDLHRRRASFNTDKNISAEKQERREARFDNFNSETGTAHAKERRRKSRGSGQGRNDGDCKKRNDGGVKANIKFKSGSGGGRGRGGKGRGGGGERHSGDRGRGRGGRQVSFH